MPLFTASLGCCDACLASPGCRDAVCSVMLAVMLSERVVAITLGELVAQSLVFTLVLHKHKP